MGFDRSGFAGRALWVLLAFSLAAPVFAQGVAPGEYIGEGGSGLLKIEPAAGGAQKFTLEAYGANGHSCSVDGALRGRQARVPTEDKEPPCVIDFKAKGDGLDISTQSNTCGYFCGARARFEGVYLKPAPGCATAEVKRTRTVFKQQYDRKAYAEARGTLAPVLEKCAKTLGSEDDSWIRNDLAITAYRLGDMAECKRVLEPLKELASNSYKEIREGFPPADAEVQLRLAKAARANLKLCGAGGK